VRSGAQNKLRTLDGVDSQNSNTKSLNAQQNLCARVADDWFFFVCLFFVFFSARLLCYYSKLSLTQTQGRILGKGRNIILSVSCPRPDTQVSTKHELLL